MWFLLLYLVTAAQAQNRVALRGSDSPCKGRLEVFNTGQWGLVCYHGWANGQSHKNGEVVCKSLRCGEHVKSGHNKDTYREPAPPTTFFMDEVKCNGTESSLWDCKTSRDAPCQADNYVVVECTGSIELQLNKNGKTDECAGVVQFKRKNYTVSVCNTEWVEARANMVCKELNCGTHFKIPKSGTFNKGKDGSSYNVPLNCTGNEEFSRQCVDWGKAKSNKCQEEANVICSNYKSLRLKGDPENLCSGQLEKKDSTENASWVPVQYRNELNETADDICSKLNCGKFSNMTRCEESNSTCLTCAEQVKVELENGCYGDIYVNLNETRQTVCYDGLSEEELRRMGSVVCKELKCGTLLTVSQGTFGQNGLLSKVDCSGEEESLWHCLAKYEHNQYCRSTRVACKNWRRLLLTDPDHACSGKVYAWDQNRLIAISNEGWDAKKGAELCKYLNCGNFSSYSTESYKQHNRSYKCTGTPKTILDCEVKEASAQLQHLSIKCNENPEVKLLGNCTGEVMINQNNRMCGNSNNTERVLGELCHHLHCRKFFTSWTTNVKGEALYFSCSDHENRLWQCNSRNSYCDSIISVACAGGVEFNFTEECGGELQARYRGKWEPVCIKSIDDAHVICRYKNCGNATVFQHSKEHSGAQISIQCKNKHVSDPVDCIKYESCRQQSTIICESGVKFNFTEECGGELQVRYGGKWEPACIKSIDDAHLICRYKNCGNAKDFQQSYEHSGAQISIQCKYDHVSDPVDCIKYEYCRQRSTIICEKHVRVVGILPSLLVGLLFLLVVVVIVIWQRKHFLTLLRLKCSPRDQDVELSRMEVQDLNTKNRDLPERKSSVFENDDYQDIDPTTNPMEEKPQSPDNDEKESTSGDSSRTEYDDVEETSDRPQELGTSSPIEPLLPPRPANLLDDARYEVILDVLDDYDDAVPSQAVVSDTGESSFSKAHVAADMSVEPGD